MPWPVPPDVDGSVVFERCQDDGHFDGGDEPICVWAPCSHLRETVIESYRKLKNAKVNDYRQGILNEAEIMETLMLVSSFSRKEITSLFTQGFHFSTQNFVQFVLGPHVGN